MISQYYTPFIKRKQDDNTKEYKQEIKELEKQEERIKSAYINGIVKMNEFDNELKNIQFKLNTLNKKIEEQKNIENFNYTADDLLILQDKSHIYRTLNPDLFLDKILSMSNAPREEVKRLIATYIDKIEVNKESGKEDIVRIDYRESFLEELVYYHNKYGIPKNYKVLIDEHYEKIPVMNDGKTSLEVQEYFNKLKNNYANDNLIFKYYELETDETLENMDFIPNKDYEKVLRLFILSDKKKYNDKTLKLGVITLDMESALEYTLNRRKNELCNI